MDPETGLDKNQVFSTWDNFKAYFNNVYEGRTGQKSSGDNINIKLGYPLYIDFNDRRFTWNSLTDMCDAGRRLRAQQIKAGALGANVTEWTTTTSRRPISYSMFRIIRVANKCIENIGMVQNAKQIDKDDLIGQAHFVRAFAHFTLCRIFGGMPYIDKALEADDSWDMTRLSAWETYARCAEDLDRAYDYFVAAGKVRRDALPGSEGHLTSSDMAYPNGIAAKALKARCLVYAASELNNLHGQSDWQDAADACAEAIRLAQQYGYDLVPFTEWNSNFYGTKYTNEHIWAWNYGSSKINTTTWSAHFGYPASNYTNASGDCPTQNFVDRFETLDGDPLLTEADRAAAAAAGHYNEQDPYTNRDPRLDKTILHDGSVVAGCPAGINIHYDPATGTYPTSSLNNNARTFGIAWGSNDSKGYSNTGYYVNKLWNGALGTAAAHQHTDPLIRMAELYLNYAEAVNEAYGPNGSAGGAGPHGRGGRQQGPLAGRDARRARQVHGRRRIDARAHPQRALRGTGLRGTPLLLRHPALENRPADDDPDPDGHLHREDRRLGRIPPRPPLHPPGHPVEPPGQLEECHVLPAVPDRGGQQDAKLRQQ